ncbi:MAG: acyltransferase [Lysobacteraceae bacterium]|nr:MAG: acyltransferase [Xanthomonadaceae bacterium]
MAEPCTRPAMAVEHERYGSGMSGALSSPLGRAWRIFATGLSFATFGLGGLVLWLVVFPALHGVVRDRGRRQRWARAVVTTAFRAFIRFMRLVGVLTYSIDGESRLKGSGLLVVANHPTLLDVVFLMACVPNATCVVKAALGRNPFTRGPVMAAGYLFNNEGSALIDACIAALQRGENLVLFPEGTRTPHGQVLGPFRRGAANILVRGAIKATPVLIECRPPALKKGQKWYHVPLARMHFTIRALPEWGGEVLQRAAREREDPWVTVRECNRELRDLFVRELSHGRLGR